MWRLRLSPTLMLIAWLAGCERPPASVDVPVGRSANSGSSGGAALEAAAIETGAIPNSIDVSPAGLFQQLREQGADSLCVRAESGDDYRFGLQVSVDEDNRCTGRGTARRVGKTLVLAFDDESRCVIVADQDGERITFPGALDRSCDALCTGRASLAGVALPRVSSDEAAAAMVRDRAGDPLCAP